MTGAQKDNPCKPDCPERTGNCHDTCEKHKRWKAAWKARIEYVRQANIQQAQVLGIHRKAVEKASKGQ